MCPALSSPQVTEREHERMVSELTAKHNEDLNQLRESMEAAHQAELQQALVYYICLCGHLQPRHAAIHELNCYKLL